MQNEGWIPEELAAREVAHARRRLRVSPLPGGRFAENGAPVLNLASNDYLDLARHPRVVAAAADALHRYGAGAGAARLVGGNLPIFEELEHRLARTKGTKAALLFGSGTMANLGLIPAVVGRGDRIYADRLAHACILDGARLSGAELARFRHNEPGHLEELLKRDAAKPGRRLIATESVFSMDGDIAPLAELVGLAETHGALILVDEAHATGALGHGGRGLVAELGLSSRVNLCMGTLSKALGSYGGYVGCSAPMRDWLVNNARTFLFATAPTPAAAGAALGALDVLQTEPDLPARLARLASDLRDRLRADGWDTLGSQTQIIPVLAGDNARALQLAAALDARGIRAGAIRPPTVPEGTARLRLSVTLAHNPADWDHLIQALRVARGPA